MAGGTPAHSIAVLLRTNGQSQVFEEALGARGIPVAMTNSTPFFRREDVRRALSALRTAATAQQGGDGAGAGGVGAAVRDALGGVGWSEEAPVGGSARERWADMAAIVAWADDTNASDLAGFLSELDERAQYQVEPDKTGVEVATIHTAKGLEWDAVFVAGVAEGLLPISYASTPAAREEERRLLYVALTRARDVLEVSWARMRATGGRGKRHRSRLLDGVWPAGRSVGKPKRQAAKESARERRERFEAEAGEEALDLFARLKAWRLGVAQAASVPAFAVLTDQTLRDIAVTRPKTVAQLRVIKGIGDVKVERFAAPVLALVRGEEVAPPEP